MDKNIINYEFLEDIIEVKDKEDKIYILKNFLTPNGLLGIKEMLKKNEDIEENWESISTINNFSTRKRLKIVFDNTINQLQKEINSKKFYSFLKDNFGIDIEDINFTIWKDLSGFEIGMHIDDIKYIDASIQIYITDITYHNLGTSFGYENGSTFLTLPYRDNFGYFSKTSNRMKHGLINRVPEKLNRFSLYINIKEKN